LLLFSFIYSFVTVEVSGGGTPSHLTDLLYYLFAFIHPKPCVTLKNQMALALVLAF